MAASKGRNVPRNRKDSEKIRDVGTMFQGMRGPAASVGAGISGMMGPKEKDYPTSAPSISKRPKARAEPVRPKARPARIEQEAAEATAVAQGNKEALRRVKEMEKKKDGGSLKSVPSGNKGLSKLPTEVRNNMGYMKSGGSVKKMGMGGSMCRGMGAATRGGKFTRDG